MPKDSSHCVTITQLMFFYFTFNYQEISCQGLKSKCSMSKGVLLINKLLKSGQKSHTPCYELFFANTCQLLTKESEDL